MSDTPPTLVTLDIADGVATLRLNRPERHNSLVPDLTDDLLEQLEWIEAERDLVAVVLAANGRSFSTGGDVRAFYDQTDIAFYADFLVGQLNRAILRLLDLPVPVICRLHGPITGGSLGLMLACDMVVAAPRAFLAPYYVEVGFSPDGGWSALLPDRIGAHRARHIQLLNQHLSADEMLALGLVDRVADDPDAVIAAWITALREEGALGLRATKARLLPPEVRERYAEGLEAERTAFVAQVADPAVRRGMERFLGLASNEAG